jgi:hypothetical protein
VATWLDDEAEFLASRWAWDGDVFRDLTLASATCPNCLHLPAFKHVIVGPAPVGSVTIQTVGLRANAPAQTTSVSCKCGMHDKAGCGREGAIDVRNPTRIKTDD